MFFLRLLMYLRIYKDMHNKYIINKSKMSSNTSIQKEAEFVYTHLDTMFVTIDTVLAKTNEYVYPIIRLLR